MISKEIFVAGLLLIGVLSYQHADANAFTERLTEKRLGDCNLQARSTSDCDFTTYGTRVGVQSAPGIIIALFMIIAYPTYIIGKYLCNCFGGRNPTHGFCCPVDDQETHEGDDVAGEGSLKDGGDGTHKFLYRKSDIVRAKLAIFAGLAAMAFAFSWGIWGAVQVTDGSADLVHQVGEIPNVLRAQINTMESELTFATFDPNTNTSGTTNFLVDDATGRQVKVEATNVIGKVDDTLTDVNGGIKSVMGKYSIAFYFIFVIPFLVIIVGVVLALVNRRGCLPMCLFHAMMVIGILIWLLQVVLTGVTMVSYDLCLEVSSLSDRQINLLVPLSGCDDDIFSGFRTQFKVAEKQTTRDACTQIAGNCYDSTQSVAANMNAQKFLQCPDNLATNCTTMERFSELATIVNSAIIIHPDIVAIPNSSEDGYTCTKAEWRSNCTFDRCASDCINATAGSLSIFGMQSKNVSLMVKGAQQVVGTIDRYGAAYSLCEPVLYSVMSPLSPGCSKAASGFAKTSQATGVTGIAMILGLFAMAWGSKRFLPLSAVHAEERAEERAAAESKIEQEEAVRDHQQDDVEMSPVERSDDVNEANQ